MERSAHWRAHRSQDWMPSSDDQEHRNTEHSSRGALVGQVRSRSTNTLGSSSSRRGRQRAIEAIRDSSRCRRRVRQEQWCRPGRGTSRARAHPPGAMARREEKARVRPMDKMTEMEMATATAPSLRRGRVWAHRARQLLGGGEHVGERCCKEEVDDHVAVVGSEGHHAIVAAWQPGRCCAVAHARVALAKGRYGLDAPNGSLEECRRNLDGDRVRRAWGGA